MPRPWGELVFGNTFRGMHTQLLKQCDVFACMPSRGGDKNSYKISKNWMEAAATMV